MGLGNGSPRELLLRWPVQFFPEARVKYISDKPRYCLKWSYHEESNFPWTSEIKEFDVLWKHTVTFRKKAISRNKAAKMACSNLLQPSDIRQIHQYENYYFQTTFKRSSKQSAVLSGATRGTEIPHSPLNEGSLPKPELALSVSTVCISSRGTPKLETRIWYLFVTSFLII